MVNLDGGKWKFPDYYEQVKALKRKINHLDLIIETLRNVEKKNDKSYNRSSLRQD